MNKEQQIIEWFERHSKFLLKNNSVILYPYTDICIKRNFCICIDFISHIEILDDEDFYFRGLDVLSVISLSFKKYYNVDFNVFLKKLKETLIKKNRDYSNSFDKSIKKFGWIYLAIELDKKKNRLHSLFKSKEKPNYESIEDTLLDIAGYCVLALIYIDNNKE